MTDENDSIIGAQAIVEDITIRKQAEEALQQKTAELDKRVRELNCLYSITALFEQPEIPLHTLLQRAVELIPRVWEDPDAISARLMLEHQEFTTDNFDKTSWTQSYDITVFGKSVGKLEVAYLQQFPHGVPGYISKENFQQTYPHCAKIRKMIDGLIRYLKQH